jgi:hypothetical protein
MIRIRQKITDRKDSLPEKRRCADRRKQDQRCMAQVQKIFVSNVGDRQVS